MTVNIPEDATLPESCRVNAYTISSDGTRSYTPYTFKILFETPLSDTLSLTIARMENEPTSERTIFYNIPSPPFRADDIRTLTIDTTPQEHHWRFHVSNSAPRVAQFQENALAGANMYGIGGTI